MKTGVAVSIVLVTSVAAACGGYWAGFREAWSMGVRADAAPRGAIALAQLQLIERGRIDDVKLGLEHDIDMGLILWCDLSKSPVSPLLNSLSGTEVIPEYEQYVRRLAAYRKTHESALSDPTIVKRLIENAAKVNPEFALEMQRGSEEAARALGEMVRKYVQEP